MARYKRQVSSIGNIGVAQGVTAGTEAAQEIGQDLVGLGQTISDQTFKQKIETQAIEDKNTILNLNRDIQPTINNSIQEAQSNIGEDENAFQDRILTIRGTYDGAINEKINNLDISDNRKEVIRNTLQTSFDAKLNPLYTARKTHLQNVNQANVLNAAETIYTQNMAYDFTQATTFDEIGKHLNNEYELYKQGVIASGSGAVPSDKYAMFQRHGKELISRYIRSLPLNERQSVLDLLQGGKEAVINGKKYTMNDLVKISGGNVASWQDLENPIKVSIADATAGMNAELATMSMKMGESTDENYKESNFAEEVDLKFNSTLTDNEWINNLDKTVTKVREIGVLKESEWTTIYETALASPERLNALVQQLPNILIGGRLANTVNVDMQLNDIRDEDGILRDVQYFEDGQVIYTALEGQDIRLDSKVKDEMETLLLRHNLWTSISDDADQQNFQVFLSEYDENRFLNVEARALSDVANFSTDSDKGKTIKELLGQNPISFFQLLDVRMNKSLIRNLNNADFGTANAHEWIKQKFIFGLERAAVERGGQVNGKIARNVAKEVMKDFRDEWTNEPEYSIGWMRIDETPTKIHGKKNLIEKAKNFINHHDLINNSNLPQYVKDQVTENGKIPMENLVFIPVGEYTHTIPYPEDKQYTNSNGFRITGTPSEEKLYYIGYQDEDNPYFTPITSNGDGRINAGVEYLLRIPMGNAIKKHEAYINADKVQAELDAFRKLMGIEGTLYPWQK